MQEPYNKALNCWCYADQTETNPRLKEKIEDKNHEWVTYQETKEVGVSQYTRFRVEIEQENIWKPINMKRKTEVSQNKICSQNGCLDLGTINIGLECSDKSLGMKLVALPDQHQFYFTDN